jgi:hypothetical protein
MNKAIKEGKLDVSYKDAVKKMKADAKKNLADQNFEKNQLYLVEQADKVIDSIIPGAGAVTSAAVTTVTVVGLGEYAKESPSYLETAKKIGKAIIVPAIVSAAVPVVAPYAVAAGAAVVGTALALDGIKYLRG